jgi:hypothetical protein
VPEIDPAFLALPMRRLAEAALSRATALGVEHADFRLERIRSQDITYYADPHLKQPGEINHHHGGRGLYFLDPSGHGMEIITRPYDLEG